MEKKRKFKVFCVCPNGCTKIFNGKRVPKTFLVRNIVDRCSSCGCKVKIPIDKDGGIRDPIFFSGEGSKGRPLNRKLILIETI